MQFLSWTTSYTSFEADVKFASTIYYETEYDLLHAQLICIHEKVRL